MAIEPRNKFFANFRALEDAQTTIGAQVAVVGAQIGQVQQTLPDPEMLLNRMGAIAGDTAAIAIATNRGFEYVGNRLEQNGKATIALAEGVLVVADETARTARAVEIIATRLDQGDNEIDRTTALYAAAVDVTGKIVARTDAGKLLNHAGYKSLNDVIANSREEFIADVRGLLEKNQAGGVIELMTDDELGRFHAGAGPVAKAIEESQPAPPPPDEAADDKPK